MEIVKADIDANYDDRKVLGGRIEITTGESKMYKKLKRGEVRSISCGTPYCRGLEGRCFVCGGMWSDCDCHCNLHDACICHAHAENIYDVRNIDIRYLIRQIKYISIAMLHGDFLVVNGRGKR
ncbi:MAG: hypothetical protein SVK08_01115 [Halobacteriota archaeon]|nr:hypothetical protein [Halobacteriota archaeon]